MKQRVRSPRYPSHSLSEAVSFTRAIFENDGLNAIDREAAVSHMGFSSLNGSSATALASIKQYGLVADAGKGMVQLTDLALDVIEPEDEESFAKGVREAAFRPPLFETLRERFPSATPSEGALRAHLLRQDFTPAAIKTAVPAYLDTCEYVAGFSATERNVQKPEVDVESDQHAQNTVDTMDVSTNTVASPLTAALHQLNPSLRRMVFDTEEGEAMFTYPGGLTSESVDDLEAWFSLVVRRLRRSTIKDDTTSRNPYVAGQEEFE